MKAVMISIRPEWVHKILKEEKTIEVRKTAPKIATPFKCYIYCTKGGKEPLSYADYCGYDMTDFREDFLANGKVVAEFVCDYIFSITVETNIHYEVAGNPVETWLEWEEAPDEYQTDKSIEKASCLTINEIDKYIGNSECCYCWHISELKIYDKPKELYEFYKCGASTMEEMDEQLCNYCVRTDYGEHRSCSTPDGYWSCEGSWCDEAYMEYLDTEYVLTRPPQSWCYVEEHK